MKQTDSGVFCISDTVAEEISPTRGIIHTAGRPDWRARNEAIASLYTEVDPVLIEGSMGKRITICHISEAGSVFTREGKLTRNEGRDFLMKKGSSRRGWYLENMRILEVMLHPNAEQALAHSWEVHSRRVPNVKKIEGLPDLPDFQVDGDGSDRPVGAVWLYTHPGFGDGPTPGCLFFGTERHLGEDGHPGDTIIDGYGWVPAGAELTSEHGSVYLRDLQRWGGQVVDFTPGKLSFADCWDLSADVDRTYGRVFDLDLEREIPTVL